MTGLIIATGLAAVILACGLAVLLTVLVCLLRPRRPARAVRLADPAPTFDERLAASVAALDGSDALATVCKACNDEDGPCTCAGLCGHPDCVGDHTMTWDMAAELEALLAGPDHGEPGRP